MHGITSASLLFALLAVTACSGAAGHRKVTLTPEGQQVRVEMNAPAGCTEVGDVYGKFESTDQEQALLGAKIDIRNRAAKMGADFVLLQTNNGSVRQDAWEGTTLGTHHQILLGGKALRCPASAAPPSPAPSAQPVKAGPGVSL